MRTLLPLWLQLLLGCTRGQMEVKVKLAPAARMADQFMDSCAACSVHEISSISEVSPPGAVDVSTCWHTLY